MFTLDSFDAQDWIMVRRKENKRTMADCQHSPARIWLEMTRVFSHRKKELSAVSKMA
jgi:hypothetical protein